MRRVPPRIVAVDWGTILEESLGLLVVGAVIWFALARGSRRR